MPREGKALSILPIFKRVAWQLFLFYVLGNEYFMKSITLNIFP